MKLGIISSEDLQVINWQAFDLIKKYEQQWRQIQNWGWNSQENQFRWKHKFGRAFIMSVQFSSQLLISSPVSQDKGPLAPVLEYIMDNSTVAWFLTRFLTRLCGHNCFPPELLRVFPWGRIKKYSFECAVSKRSSVICLWVDGFCFFVKTIWHGERWRAKRFKWPICLAFRDNLGKNWDLTKEKLRPRSGLYL
jgi:hypothetical protein